MDDDSKIQSMVKLGLGALGLGALAAVIAIPKLGMMSLWIVLAIVVLALLLFGGYYLWQRTRAKRRREQFTSAIEQQTSAAPRAISDPNKRASLDKVRQKFQTGLQEFKSRGKDIYKLPWYVIIGESGSGKTEAIRHSGIDFPPGLQDELQGSGGTVNMDWWFTNRGIILDTAGSMLFSEARAGEAPEWREFLRLLKKSRPHCPVNGLFLVLSIESLIKDSADKIAQKASTLAQQLDLIQRTLDVRFPVYLLVTKCDLLTGFREFFDNIDDPLLQHQMFGWSNPDPLDSPFRPDLIEQHLKGIADKIRRRRLAVLREAATAPQYGDTQQFFRSQTSSISARRIDSVDSMFALPESVMRLAPRLRRYLETIFVAGEWSSKPVFLRGVYFTSSMREGKALDEAIAFATGLQLDQLPEGRSWEKNRAFFLRDLFHEKVFRESGLVTRATNTLKMLRQQQMLIFGSAAAALVILMTFAGFAYFSLKRNILTQSASWRLGAENWANGQWTSASIIKPTDRVYSYTYAGKDPVDLPGKPSVIEYHRQLADFADKGLSVGWVFKPVAVFSKVRDLPEAQQALFEGGVLRPLVFETRKKMMAQAPDPQNPASIARHQAALLALMQLEADNLSKESLTGTNGVKKAEKYLSPLLSYLTDSDQTADPALAALFARTYSRQSKDNVWPPETLLGGASLSNNAAIRIGLDNFRVAHQVAESNIRNEVQLLNGLVAALSDYRQSESQWLASKASCASLKSDLANAKTSVDTAWNALAAITNLPGGTITNIEFCYTNLENAARQGSLESFQTIWAAVPGPLQSEGIFGEIKKQVTGFASAAAQTVKTNFESRAADIRRLDADYILPKGNLAVFERRWSLYTSACKLSSLSVKVDETIIGDGWKSYNALKDGISQYQTQLAAYNDAWPLAELVTNACNQIAADAELSLKGRFVEGYADAVSGKLTQLVRQTTWDMGAITNTARWLQLIQSDLQSAPPEQRAKLAKLSDQLKSSVTRVVAGISDEIRTMTGFPVLLDSTRPMNIDDMKKLKTLVNGLKAELQSPIWQLDADGVKRLGQRCDSYVSVVNALTDEHGNPAQWELWFVPANSDRDIVKDYRWMQASFGDASEPAKPRDMALQSNPVSLGKGSAESPVVISFAQFEGQKPSNPVSKQQWSLVQLIRDLNASPVNNDGANWEFRVKLTDKEQSLSGDVGFQAKLLGARRLPDLKVWPRD